jgi:hypothetical protein
MFAALPGAMKVPFDRLGCSVRPAAPKAKSCVQGAMAKPSHWFDARDLAWVEDHDGPLPHPAQDRPQ